MRRCQNCGTDHPRNEMQWTRDCQGIPFHFVCPACYERLMAKGYDGFSYTQADIDEPIEPEEW